MPVTIDDLPIGTWREGPSSAVFLTIAEGGALSGYDGCNTVGGSWTAKNDVITFDGYGNLTEAGCLIDNWLIRAHSVIRDAEGIVVLDDSGATVGHLAPAD